MSVEVVTAGSVRTAIRTLGAWSNEAMDIAGRRVLLPSPGRIDPAGTPRAVIDQAFAEMDDVLPIWPLRGFCDFTGATGAIRLHALATKGGAVDGALHGAVALLPGPVDVAALRGLPTGPISNGNFGPKHNGVWAYHVAAAGKDAATGELLVLDPGLFDRPVSTGQWAEIMHETADDVLVYSPFADNFDLKRVGRGIDLLADTPRLSNDAVAGMYHALTGEWAKAPIGQAPINPYRSAS